MASSVLPFSNSNRGRSKGKRFVAVALPAGGMTLALYALMQSLIQVNYVSAPDQTVYELSAYIEQANRDETIVRQKKPPRPKPIDPPPMMDQLVKSVSNPDLPINGYDGVAPAVYDNPDLRILMPTRTTSVIDRRIQPLTPPTPVYPDSAAKRGMTGACDVHFSVSPKGDPFNIAAKCSDRVFKRAAEKAVSKVKFAPKIHDGLPVTVTGAVYPIVFQMDP
ncbi:MAG: energy transducer TonB [Pseudomonadota bacterium]